MKTNIDIKALNELVNWGNTDGVEVKLNAITTYDGRKFWHCYIIIKKSETLRAEAVSQDVNRAINQALEKFNNGAF